MFRQSPPKGDQLLLPGALWHLLLPGSLRTRELLLKSEG